MNISKINEIPLSNAYMSANLSSYNSCYANKYGLKLTPTLTHDTVIFTSKSKKVQTVMSKELKAAAARKKARTLRDEKLQAEAKIKAEKGGPTKKTLDAEDHIWGVSYEIAQRIHDELLKPQEKVHKFMQKVFGDMVVSPIFPKNPLYEIGDRRKSASSIMEKSSTRHWDTLNEVYEKMTDLNGAKIVFNYKTGKNDAEGVLDRLIPLIKTKQVSLKEIELQRPQAIENKKKETDKEVYDYVTKMFLDRLEDAQEEVINGLECDVNKIKLIDRPLPKYTEGNYCALHLLLQLPGESRPFELQIMGPRVADGKHIDDLRFKYFKGKQIDKKYNKIETIWEPLKDKENVDAKERFIQYCKDANLELRERELREFESQRIINRGSKRFISVLNYYLPPEYDLDNLLQIMIECDRVADNAAKKPAIAKAKVNNDNKSSDQKKKKAENEKKTNDTNNTETVLGKLLRELGIEPAKKA